MDIREVKILVVESQPADAEAIVLAFAAEPKTTVQVAATLRDYRKLLAVPAMQKPNLVIMSLALPGGSAVATLVTPWEEGPFPVLVMAEQGQEESAVQALEAGATDYIVKSPVALANMPCKARRILREWGLLQERRRSRQIIDQLASGWQRTFDAIPYPIFLLNTGGVITQCNKATLAFCGKERDEVVGAYCWEVIHRTAEPICNCPLPAMRQSRQREVLILPVGDKVFQISVDPVLDNGGELIGAVHSMEEITERQRTEERLRAQEAELTAIYDNAPLVMMLVDNERKIRKVNRQAIALADATVADMVGRRSGEALGCIHAFEHPEGCGFGPNCQSCTVRRIIIDTIESGHSHYQVETKVSLSANGVEKVLPFLLSSTRITIHNQPMALVSLMDISQLKETEESLRQTHGRLAAVMDSINALIYVADMTTYELLFVNKYGRDVWGEIEGEICWQTLQSDQDGPCPFCTNDKLLHTDGTATGVYAWEFQNTQNGHWYDCRDQAIRWSDGHLVRIEIATDITDRKAAEERLRQSQKMDTIGTLAGGIAHDFNNILTSILGFANLAHDDLSPESLPAKDIQQVIYAGERAKELVKQILTFSRQRTEECQPVQAGLLVKEVLKLLRASIPSTIEIKSSILAQERTIMIDPSKLHQVVMNLCTNAYQAMKVGGGTLRVALEPVVYPAEGGMFGQETVAGEYLRLTVQDSGCGMDKETMGRIFEPYFTTKDKEDGTGLGLSVVHGIVRSSKGFIAVQSAQGEGSVFQVIWPVFQGASQHQPGASTGVLPRGNERILMVDDEPAVVSINERELRILGYQVTTMTSPLDALEAFRLTPKGFDLVITDYAMPKMDGVFLAQSLLAIDPEAKIILLTGFSEVQSTEALAGLGVKRLLLKPVIREDLARTIRAVLDEKTPDGG